MTITETEVEVVSPLDVAGVRLLLRLPSYFEPATLKVWRDTLVGMTDGVVRVGPLYGAERVYVGQTAAAPIWGALVAGFGDPLDDYDPAVDGDATTFLQRIAAGHTRTIHANPVPVETRSAAGRLLSWFSGLTSAGQLIAFLDPLKPPAAIAAADADSPIGRFVGIGCSGTSINGVDYAIDEETGIITGLLNGPDELDEFRQVFGA